MKRKRPPKGQQRTPRRARRIPGGARKRRAPAQHREPRERHQSSPTAVALEAERTGILPTEPVEPEIPREEQVLRAGDPDVSTLANEYSGEEIPGADMPTPDQSVVDEIGRAYGLDDGGAEPLRPVSEVLERRDRKRRG